MAETIPHSKIQQFEVELSEIIFELYCAGD